MEDISLPEHVSQDGREIWDWASRLSAIAQRNHLRRTLTRDIAQLQRECGSCDKWMKSRECPREHNDNGQSRGPSCRAPICSAFIMSSSSAALLERWSAELADLTQAALKDGEQAAIHLQQKDAGK